MTVTTVMCDTCGNADARAVSYFVDRRMDAAGSMENEYETVDLCADHMASLLGELLNRKSNFVSVAAYLPVVRAFRKRTL